MNKTNIRNAAGIAAAVTELTAAFGDGVVTAKLRSLWQNKAGDVRVWPEADVRLIFLTVSY